MLLDYSTWKILTIALCIVLRTESKRFGGWFKIIQDSELVRLLVAGNCRIGPHRVARARPWLALNPSLFATCLRSAIWSFLPYRSQFLTMASRSGNRVTAQRRLMTEYKQLTANGVCWVHLGQRIMKADVSCSSRISRWHVYRRWVPHNPRLANVDTSEAFLLHALGDILASVRLAMPWLKVQYPRMIFSHGRHLSMAQKKRHLWVSGHLRKVHAQLIVNAFRGWYRKGVYLLRSWHS